MKKLLLLTLGLVAGLSAAAQNTTTNMHLQSYGDMVEQNRAAVEDARRVYQEKSTSGSQQIEELERVKSAHENELDAAQQDLKFAKEREKNMTRSLKLNQQKLQLQQKTRADQYSLDLTRREIQRLRNEAKMAKADVKRISQDVAIKKRAVAADKKAINEVKKSVNAAKQDVRQQEKFLKQSEKLQQKVHQHAAGM